MSGEWPQLHTDPLMRVSLFVWAIYAQTYLRAMDLEMTVQGGSDV